MNSVWQQSKTIEILKNGNGHLKGEVGLGELCPPVAYETPLIWATGGQGEHGRVFYWVPSISLLVIPHS